MYDPHHLETDSAPQPIENIPHVVLTYIGPGKAAVLVAGVGHTEARGLVDELMARGTIEGRRFNLCTGYVNDDSRIHTSHDGDACPVHEDQSLLRDPYSHD